MVVMTYQKSYSIQHTMIHVLSVEVVFSSPWIITFSRLKTCIDAEQRCPTIKKLEVKQVEFKLGEDCWEIQEYRSYIIVIPKPVPTSAGKYTAALKMLGVQAGQDDIGSRSAAHA
ncbi:hypothetical protein Tco_1097732 [Tanacetum coccineum]